MAEHLRSAFYTEGIRTQRNAAEKLTRKSNGLVAARLVAAILFITFIILGATGSRASWFWMAVAPAAVFLLLVRLHQSVHYKKRFAGTLADLYQAELHFLEGGDILFPDGQSFVDPHHVYSYDLDLFGPRSLFQYLNRSETVPGSAALAQSLLQKGQTSELIQRQEAIQELNALPEWRMNFRAKARLAHDSEPLFREISQWTCDQTVFPKALTWLRFLLPITGGLLTAAFLLTGIMPLLNLCVIIFVVNITLLASQYKHIQCEIAAAEKISETLHGYSELILAVEKRHWESELLKATAARLKASPNSSSALLNDLSGIFRSLESIQNGFGAIVFNGTVLYHLHAYRRLLEWKKQHASLLQEGLEIIGELEVLISFSNFSYNNPAFCFPSFNEDRRLQFTDLGHPLIAAPKRVANTVDFTEQPFIILTGSNMSGKSTFLRTLGINLVLANAGGPVCASTAQLQPLDILVCMRLSDSLSDSESYFFAEVKRLKSIVESLDERPCFVLLDEILRGTNSDDKRNGTIAVVEKMVALKAIGVIATHDLEVCPVADRHPGHLTNNCFEVEIRANELYFDYKLRKGICKNKSATFLMRKMGVISPETVQ